MKYLRFGEIPQNEKSINFLKMSFDQQESFHHLLNEECDISRALECVPADAWEDGISVFEIGPDGLPVLSNLHIITSLLSRLEKPIYEVEGVEVARGNDGEPLVNNISTVNRVNIDSDTLIHHCIGILKANFKNVEYNDQEAPKTHKLLSFRAEYKINTVTGEKVSIWEPTKGSNWKKLEPYTEYCLDCWTFSEPINSFDVRLGISK